VFTLSTRRLELHWVLCNLLGSQNVYFQPPSNINIRYPCIVYSLNSVQDSYADDHRYDTRKCYSVQIIDQDPDSEIPDSVSNALEMCSFNRRYVADNMYHTVYSVYF
jgi:hypothetical protein